MDNHTSKIAGLSAALESLKAEKQALMELTYLTEEMGLFFMRHPTISNLAYAHPQEPGEDPGLVPLHRAPRYKRDEGVKAMAQLSNTVEQPKLTNFLDAIEEALQYTAKMIRAVEIEFAMGIPQAGQDKVH